MSDFLGGVDVIPAMDVDSTNPKPHGGDCQEDKAIRVEQMGGTLDVRHAAGTLWTLAFPVTIADV